MTGTESEPAVLDPFKSYVLVMAANECRYFTMKVPSQWYLEATLTVVSRDEKHSGHLGAELAQSDNAWQALPETQFKKMFDLFRGGSGRFLGVGNPGPSRAALLRLCQDGVPVKVTIESQISPLSQLPAVTGQSFQGQ